MAKVKVNNVIGIQDNNIVLDNLFFILIVSKISGKTTCPPKENNDIPIQLGILIISMILLSITIFLVVHNLIIRHIRMFQLVWQQKL